MEPASPLGVEAFADGVDERGQVVVRPALDLGHTLGRGRRRLRASPLRDLRADDPELAPRVERRQLDLEPQLQLALLGPDPGHLGSGVARDH